MPMPATSKQQVLAALTAATPTHQGPGSGEGQDQDGLAGLSMGELATRAGVSRATLYRLVAGKEALFAELVRRFSPFEPIAAVLETMGDRPPAEVIPAIPQGMVQAMRTLPLVAGYLASQMAAGHLRRMDPVLAFQALVGPIVMHLLMQA